jgi:hypothetical protein
MCGEVEGYRLKLELNDLGRAYLTVADHLARMFHEAVFYRSTLKARSVSSVWRPVSAQKRLVSI